MLHQINAILTTWDYGTALQLLIATGESPALARLLQSTSQTPFMERKLRRELRTIATHLSELSPVPTPGHPEPVEGSPISDSNNPNGESHPNPDHHPTLSPTLQERNAALRRLDYLRGTLTLLETDEQRLETALQILALDRQVNACWKVIHYFREHGHLPPDEIGQVIAKATTWGELAKIRSNFATNVSRSKNGKMPAEKLHFYQAVLDRCDQLLSQPIKPTTQNLN